jgi:hypothetical protein
MNVLLIRYEAKTDRLIAEINKELGIYVHYCPRNGSVEVFVHKKVLRKFFVGRNYAASSFVEFCQEYKNLFNQVPDFFDHENNAQ